jgi:hypothetical protein
VNWETLESGEQRCVDHGHEFGSLGYCPDCTSDYEPAITERSSETNKLAFSDEKYCREMRNEIAGIARDLSKTKKGDFADLNAMSVAVKYFDAALKWHRAAMAERGRRGDKEFAEWLVAEKQRLLNRGAN